MELLQSWRKNKKEGVRVLKEKDTQMSSTEFAHAVYVGLNFLALPPPQELLILEVNRGRT